MPAPTNQPLEKNIPKELVVIRTFRAPRELVFKAWTDPKHIEQWWGPRCFTNKVHQWDARPGGLIHLDMLGPEGTAHPMKGVFREVVEPERLVFTATAFEDEQGIPRLENLNTVTFEEIHGVTEQTLHVVVLKSGPEIAQALAGMNAGWNQSLDKLMEFTTTTGTAIHPTFGNGKICYIKLPATNIQRSAEFYQKVFGWNVRKRGDGSTAFDDGVGQVSGTWVTNSKPATEPGWFFYIMVDSVAATVDAVIANGGKLIQPIGKDAPEITAHFSDPAGNVIGLYQEPNH